MTEYIDTHTHAYDEAFAGCEDEVVARGVAAGVTVQLQADVDSRERERMFALVERHPGVLRPMLGLYPGSVDKDWRREIDALETWRGRGIVAVGEIGLDYHYGAEFKAEQQEAFRVQLELAAAKRRKTFSASSKTAATLACGATCMPSAAAPKVSPACNGWATGTSASAAC